MRGPTHPNECRPSRPSRPADMLPTGIKEKLLRIAEQVKKKHKEQQAAAQEGSWRDGHHLFERVGRSRHGGDRRGEGSGPGAERSKEGSVQGSPASSHDGGPHDCGPHMPPAAQHVVDVVVEGTHAAAARVAEGTHVAAAAAADAAEKAAMPFVGLK